MLMSNIGLKINRTIGNGAIITIRRFVFDGKQNCIVHCAFYFRVSNVKKVKGTQLDAFIPRAIVYCYLEFKLSYLKT